MTKYIIGLMSGSSLDGLDIALCEFRYDTLPQKGKIDWKILKSVTIPYDEDWQIRLRKTPSMSALALAETDAALGQLFGESVANFISNIENNIKIDLIASHGHTVFHFPEKGFSTQIGHGAFLAKKCNLPVLYDVRMADIAQGGQGAPLAPVVDEWLFPDYDLFLNLGGIANISAKTKNGFIGFDIFGANQTLDALANQLDLRYDNNGSIASKGRLNNSLYKKLKDLPFLQLPYPKSLDNQWVMNNITQVVVGYSDTIPNKLATMVAVLAEEVASSIEEILPLMPRKNPKLLITGGGAHNRFLIDRIKHHCAKNIEVIIPSKSIINNKESLLMALMGLLHLNNLPNSNPTVTGARNNSVGGVLVYP